MKYNFKKIISVVLFLIIQSCNSPVAPPGENVLLTGKITFSTSTADTTAIYIINPDGTELKQIMKGGVNPKWSPDGTRILYRAPSIYSRNNYAVYIMNADGSNAHIVPAQPSNLSTGEDQQWSPNGEKIIYSHSLTEDLVAAYNIVIVDLFNGSTLEIKNDISVEDIIPKWSPDGKKIIFLSNRDYINTNYTKRDLYLMDADGKNIKRLTQNGSINYYLWYPSDQSIIFSVGQSRDVTSDGIGRVDTAGNLLWFNDMPGNIRFGKLSNNGKRLAFCSSTGIIQILDIKSKSIQKVIVNSVSDFKYYPVDWSIDDKELLVISTPKYSDRGYLEMVKISNGIVKRLLDDDKIISADWHK